MSSLTRSDLTCRWCDVWRHAVNNGISVTDTVSVIKNIIQHYILVKTCDINIILFCTADSILNRCFRITFFIVFLKIMSLKINAYKKYWTHTYINTLPFIRLWRFGGLGITPFHFLFFANFKRLHFEWCYQSGQVKLSHFPKCGLNRQSLLSQMVSYCTTMA